VAKRLALILVPVHQHIEQAEFFRFPVLERRMQSLEPLEALDELPQLRQLQGELHDQALSKMESP
jgi:hypothetical protein